MNRAEHLQAVIDSYYNPKRKSRQWYQRITLAPGVVTPGRKDSGEVIWPEIRALMPQSIENKSVLDLGSNAGYFCVMSALDGAKPVVGVERSPVFLSQADFIKKHFEEKARRFLPIRYIDQNLDFFKDDPCPIFFDDPHSELIIPATFDISLCIAAFYQIKGPNVNIAKWLGRMTNSTIIVRCIRNHERGQHTVFTNVLTNMGWELTHIDEGNRRRYLVRYQKK